MTQVILRVDDICATTRPADVATLYGPAWTRGVPLCCGVIPVAAYRFAPGGPLPDDPVDIRANPELVALLAAQQRAGLAAILLHGLHHHPGEWATASPATIADRVRAGRDVLRAAWPDAPLHVAVPPHDYLSPAGLHALRTAGWAVCSSWAAVHGGTRRAHWQGRLRRGRGLPFAPPADGRWPTDITLLDFAGPEAGDWPHTRRVLRLAARWACPVVFVQHPWRLLHADGTLNARGARWRRWLDRLLDEPGVCVTQFSEAAA
jgi:hypothetical protein